MSRRLARSIAHTHLIVPIALLATCCTGTSTSTSDDSVTPAEDVTSDSAAGTCPTKAPAVSYGLTDTNLKACYDSKGDVITCPAAGELFAGQDAAYDRLATDYSLVCDDQVVLDGRTGLMWERSHHGERVSYSVVESYCEGLSPGGFDDWRVPTIKELLSISDWSGSQHVKGAYYLDSKWFDFDYPELDSAT